MCQLHASRSRFSAKTGRIVRPDSAFLPQPRISFRIRMRLANAVLSFAVAEVCGFVSANPSESGSHEIRRHAPLDVHTFASFAHLPVSLRFLLAFLRGLCIAARYTENDPVELRQWSNFRVSCMPKAPSEIELASQTGIRTIVHRSSIRINFHVGLLLITNAFRAYSIDLSGSLWLCSRPFSV